MTNRFSDDGRLAQRSAHHLCHQEGCNRWGSWGYDAGDGIASWWCIEHRPDHDPAKPIVRETWVSDGNEG